MSIEVRALTKHFGAALALNGVSFEVPSGQVAGFCGPNGAGKSTTMRILTGVIGATSGRATVCGHDVATEADAVRRRVGYLPESAPLYGELFVFEYLEIVCGVRKVARARRRAKVEAAVERCGLAPVLGRPIRELSKGYRQRVGLAQAIVHEPDVLILDEPTSGLDPNQLEDIRRLIRSLGEKKTVLFSSHIMQEVEAVSGRVIIVDSGRVVADGPPSELRARLGSGGSIRALIWVPADTSAEEVVERLGRIEGVDHVTVDQQPGPAGAVAVVVKPASDTDLRPRLFDEVVAARDWKLLEMGLTEGGLEAVFRAVTVGGA